VTLDLDPERRLALAYVPAPHRAAIETLWRLDVTLGSVLATGREPMISRIRLAWWRESLEKLDSAPPPAEPMLEAVARDLLALGLNGTALAALEEGWAALLVPEAPAAAELELYATARGGRLFALSARLLGGDERVAARGGEVWSLVDLARHSGSEAESSAALAAASARALPRLWPKNLRPLGMIAMLALRDAERGLPLAPQGSPVRMLRMLGHRLTGR
jgi:15-cis-phytoene synthase